MLGVACCKATRHADEGDPHLRGPDKGSARTKLLLEIKEQTFGEDVMKRLTTLIRKYKLEDVVILWLIGMQAHPVQVAEVKAVYPWLQVRMHGVFDSHGRF